MLTTLRRGLAAGAAGVTALNAVTYVDMAWRGRPASSTPERAVERLAERARVVGAGSGARSGGRTAGRPLGAGRGGRGCGRWVAPRGDPAETRPAEQGPVPTRPAEGPPDRRHRRILAAVGSG